MSRMEPLICEVCEDEEAIGVAAVPAIPYSAAYGRRCLEANAHPLWILIANTATMYDGRDDVLDGTADFWKQMVADTLAHLGKSMDEFSEAVKASG